MNLSPGDRIPGSSIRIQATPLGDGIHLNLPAFEGPMDLLLYLIRREELDIFDIPIAQITDEYLRTLDVMKAANLEVGGEFLVLAATLLSIKARMLLPRPSIEGVDVDPRRDLVERILEYRAFKESAEIFRQLEEKQSDFFGRGTPALPEEIAKKEAAVDVSLYDLLLAFRFAMDRFKAEKPSYELEIPSEKVEQRIDYIRLRLTERKRISFSAIVLDLPTRLAVIMTFLAILELVRLGEIGLKSVDERDFLIVSKQA
ncbi:MAG: segregation/condensation protein A [bacterium]|nr:segregation/condensation protein A [bacterium]